MKYTLIVFSIFSLSACDQVTSEYGTFEQASEENLFQKGWIPEKLVNENISDIFLRNNIDLNTFIFSFRTDSLELKNYQIQESNLQIDVRRINIPTWWLKEVKGNTRYVFTTDNGSIVNLTFNKKTGKIYGWGEY